MGESEHQPKPHIHGTVDERFAMATHHGLRCDARGRSCIKLADVEFTLRPVDANGDTGAEVLKQCCPRHRAEFLDEPDTWEYVAVRKFVKLANGRLRNQHFTVGSDCDDTCTSCAYKRQRTAGDSKDSAA